MTFLLNPYRFAAGGSVFDDLAAEVLADSPAGFWPLDETSGTTAADLSGNGRDGTYTGSYSLGSAVGSLPGVDLTGGYVSIPDNAAWSSSAGANGLLTVEAWVKFDTLAAQMNVVCKGAASNYEFDFRTGDATASAFLGQVYTSAGGVVMGPGQAADQVAAGIVLHLVFTYDRAAQSLIVYKQGVALSSDSTASSTASDGTAPLLIGERADGAGVTLDGQIGCVAIYPTALSAARIAAHYAAGTP